MNATTSAQLNWIRIFFALGACVALSACSHLPKTLAEMQPYGYTPLDPLPVIVTNAIAADLTNTQVMLQALPDETMRLAVGQVGASGNITYGPASIGYAGSNYLIVLDYVKYIALPQPLFLMSTGPQSNIWIYTTTPYTNEQGTVVPDHVLPVYVGIGLRMTAHITVNSGTLNLGNLTSIGAAADAKAVSGTLVIQTMGISGQSVSSAIPIPTDVNSSTIANALMAVGTIKSKFYDTTGAVTIKPQVLAVYKNFGKDEPPLNDPLSPLLWNPLILDTTIGAVHAFVQTQPAQTGPPKSKP